MRKRVALSAIAGFVLLAADQKKDADLAPIPKEAELVCQSAAGGEKSEFGVPATEIYVAAANGDHLTRVTHQKKLYNHIAVSPDRTMIAAGRYDRGDTSGDGQINSKDRKTLVVLDLEKKQEWSIVPEADDVCLGGVDWTPDGKYIVASMKFGGQVDIYRVHPDGTGLENLTKNLGKLLGLASRPVFVSDASVSFDGNWIVFLSVTKKGELCKLTRMRIDGSEAHVFSDGGGAASHNAGTFGAGDYDPEFSPDGQFVSFQRSTEAGPRLNGFPSYDVYRIRIDGTDLLRLSPAGNKAIMGISDWSRDDRIVFSEWNPQEGWSGPVLVNPDGTNYHRIGKLKGCAWVRWIPPLG
jgi:Tol biopolymer transport system component